MERSAFVFPGCARCAYLGYEAGRRPSCPRSRRCPSDPHLCPILVHRCPSNGRCCPFHRQRCRFFRHRCPSKGQHVGTLSAIDAAFFATRAPFRSNVGPLSGRHAPFWCNVGARSGNVGPSRDIDAAFFATRAPFRGIVAPESADDGPRTGIDGAFFASRGSSSGSAPPGRGTGRGRDCGEVSVGCSRVQPSALPGRRGLESARRDLPTHLAGSGERCRDAVIPGTSETSRPGAWPSIRGGRPCLPTR